MFRSFPRTQESRATSAGVRGPWVPAFAGTSGEGESASSLRRLELDHHGARVTPVRHRIRIGIALRARIALPVGLIHHGEDVVGHQRDDRYLAHGELHEFAAERE